jgi:putative transposase
MRYRRVEVAGGTYFFTVNLADRAQGWLVEYVDDLREVLRAVKRRHPFHIDAMVIMPDHLHALWTLPVGDVGYPLRWMLIKAGFSRRLPRGERLSASRVAKGERGVFGSGVIGSIRCATQRTMLGTWITFITTL